VPYMVSVEDLVNSIVEAVRGGKLKGIRDVRNETGKKGIRAVVELERGFDAGSVENALYKHTKCESTLKIALVAYKGSEFSQYSAKGILTEWIAFRRATVRSVLAYEVGQIYARLHIVEGLIRALSMIDKVIAIIRKAADPSAELQSSLGFSAIQAEAILETKLRRLAKLEVAALQAEEAKLGVSLGEKEAILDDPKLLDGTIVAGLRAASAKFGWERRTFLAEIDTSITVEDTLPDETFLIVTTNGGFIKRVRHEQSAQLKGGKGMSVGKVRDGDFVSRAFHAGTKDHLLFFTNTGRVFDLKAWEVPEAKLDSFGKPMGGICQLAEGERIVQLLNLTNAQFEDPEAFLMFGTRKGLVKKTPMPEYSNIRKTGLIALKVRDDDSLLNVVYVDASIQDVFMAHTWGKGITFPHSDVRPVGRDTFGMMGMDFDSENGCEACAFEAVPGWEGYDVITVASDGNGKRSPLGEYVLQGRYGKGRIATHLRPGVWLVKAVIARPDQDVVITSTKNMIRMTVEEVRQYKRDTLGNRLIKLAGEQMVVDVAVVDADVVADTE
jgi:DNA gyrase subunit A